MLVIPQAGVCVAVISLVHGADLWVLGPLLTFFLSLIDPLPLTMILQPVSCSSCLVVIPRGPSIRPTKLNWKRKKGVSLGFWILPSFCPSWTRDRAPWPCIQSLAPAAWRSDRGGPEYDPQSWTKNMQGIVRGPVADTRSHCHPTRGNMCQRKGTIRRDLAHFYGRL